MLSVITFDYKIKIPTADKLIKDYGLEPGGRLQKVVDSTILKYSVEYTPMDTGHTIRSVSPSIGSGVLYYPGPYAHYIWEGISKSGKPLNYRPKGSLRGKEWIKRAMADHLEDVCRIAEEDLKNGR